MAKQRGDDYNAVNFRRRLYGAYKSCPRIALYSVRTHTYLRVHVPTPTTHTYSFTTEVFCRKSSLRNLQHAIMCIYAAAQFIRRLQKLITFVMGFDIVYRIALVRRVYSFLCACACRGRLCSGILQVLENRSA